MMRFLKNTSTRNKIAHEVLSLLFLNFNIERKHNMKRWNILLIICLMTVISCGGSQGSTVDTETGDSDVVDNNTESPTNSNSNPISDPDTPLSNYVYNPSPYLLGNYIFRGHVADSTCTFIRENETNTHEIAVTKDGCEIVTHETASLKKIITTADDFYSCQLINNQLHYKVKKHRPSYQGECVLEFTEEGTLQYDANKKEYSGSFQSRYEAVNQCETYQDHLYLSYDGCAFSGSNQIHFFFDSEGNAYEPAEYDVINQKPKDI